MTQPRQVLPGTTYMVGRRTNRRHFLLRPDAKLNQLALYVVAVYAAKYGIEIHLVHVQSNHFHIVLTDVRGNLPDFMRDANRIIALGVKCLRGWDGAVWDHEPPSTVDLRTPEAIVKELAYGIDNPVKDGAVRYSKDWPGVSARPHELGRKVYRVRRPDFFFDANNPQWPDEVELRLTLPKMLLDAYGADGARRAVAQELARQEHAARAEAKRKGLKFMGADRCLKASPYRRAKSQESIRKRNPTFAVGPGNREAFFEAVRNLRAFRAAYREALAKWRTGDRDVVFPPGTWWMRTHHRVRCAEPPPACAA